MPSRSTRLRSRGGSGAATTAIASALSTESNPSITTSETITGSAEATS